MQVASSWKCEHDKNNQEAAETKKAPARQGLFREMICACVALFLFAEVDVHVVASLVAGVVHLLQAPVFAAVGGLEVEGSFAQAFLSAVDMVDLHGDGAGEQQVVGVDNLNLSVDLQVVVVFARELFALAAQLAVGILRDVARAEIVPRDPLKAQHVLAQHLLFGRLCTFGARVCVSLFVPLRRRQLRASGIKQIVSSFS